MVCKYYDSQRRKEKEKLKIKLNNTKIKLKYIKNTEFFCIIVKTNIKVKLRIKLYKRYNNEIKFR